MATTMERRGAAGAMARGLEQVREGGKGLRREGREVHVQVNEGRGSENWNWRTWMRWTEGRRRGAAGHDDHEAG